MCRNCGGRVATGLCLHCRIKIDELNNLSDKIYYEDDFHCTRDVENTLYKVKQYRDSMEILKKINKPKEPFVIKV